MLKVDRRHYPGDEGIDGTKLLQEVLYYPASRITDTYCVPTGIIKAVVL